MDFGSKVGLKEEQWLCAQELPRPWAAENEAITTNKLRNSGRKERAGGWLVGLFSPGGREGGRSMGSAGGGGVEEC